MKTNYTKYLEEGLHIVDEKGVPFENEFENDLIHQEMADRNIDHYSELAEDRYLRKKEEMEYEIDILKSKNLKFQSEAAIANYI